MTMGEPTDGDSNRARKAHVRSARHWQEKEFKMVSQVDSTPMIQFGHVYIGTLQRPYNDALVITTTIEDYNIARTFIDTGNSMDIMFL